MCANASGPEICMVLFGGCQGTEYAQLCRICFAVRQSLVCVVSLHLGPPIAFQNLEELSALVCIQIRKGARGVGVHVKIPRGLRRLIASRTFSSILAAVRILGTRFHHFTGLNFWTLLPQSVSAT